MAKKKKALEENSRLASRSQGDDCNPLSVASDFAENGDEECSKIK